jgi:MtN3 and saliva related transmembrane protein
MIELKPELIGIIAGILTSSSLVPQVIKIIKLKEAKDISVMMVIALMTGTGLWCYYGFVKDDFPIIITNAFSATLNGFMLLLKVKYTKNSKR